MDNERHLVKLQDEKFKIIMEEDKMNEITNYDELSREEMIALLRAKPREELAEKSIKRTYQGGYGGLTHEGKIALLSQKFPNLGPRSLELLCAQKDRRRFVETEDGISVVEVEEKS
jgi:hypothetical protein